MHPQLFLKTFWQMEVRSQIFVAMSFNKKYNERFDEIIAPAIRSTIIDGIRMEPYRVDLSKSGDSILTDIVDGIAHSQLVLADVSTIGKDSITGESYRNANVMYEVGLALACRQPTEILLIRDDRDEFLFDVSTIPHVTINFNDPSCAIDILKSELADRIKERKFIDDARVRIVAESMTRSDINSLVLLCRIQSDYYTQKYGEEEPEIIAATNKLEPGDNSRLLDKQIVRRYLGSEGDTKEFIPTKLGKAVFDLLNIDRHLSE